MNILFLSRWFPYPTNNGSKLRIFNLLRGLSQRHAVTLLSFADQPAVTPEIPEMRSICADVQVIPWKEFNPHSWRASLALLSMKPRSVVDTFSPEMAQTITQILSVKRYDLVIASQLSMAAYYPYFQNVPALFEEVEIGLIHDQANSADRKIRFRHALTWFKLRRYLFQLLRFFDACTVVSEKERRLLVKSFPEYKKTIEVIPNCMRIEDYKSLRADPKPNSLIFSGSFRYYTNYEAMLWFVREVYPLILEKIPEAHLTITGDHAGLPLPFHQSITLAGYVDDINSMIASSSVSIAPLWNGGGTRLKILEAMAIGVPVVATSKGAEGLDALNGEHLLIAESPEEFAGHVTKLLYDPIFRNHIASNARQFVRERFDWDVVMPKFLYLVEQTANV